MVKVSGPVGPGGAAATMAKTGVGRSIELLLVPVKKAIRPIIEKLRAPIEKIARRAGNLDVNNKLTAQGKKAIEDAQAAWLMMKLSIDWLNGSEGVAVSGDDGLSEVDALYG